jgi:hypothetical protein
MRCNNGLVVSKNVIKYYLDLPVEVENLEIDL